ncbi:PP2C family protein-serine/threonine phosphatase [Saccharopolyspora phatthalungensis]|uniref:Putative methionine-R-sulfoxide reductase with GAF domain n=1 Tax=Saccharopolyspora phatthalungensis TaxID=664693 RepID=A0A840QAQ6_9PSEU|nr:GAF domain-containing SpoIIE family protein phosphatase [Saccharopolyspora phatthalungensis]MBB5156900.1 putative methionine-R-sulfoxide reductase with GAF domain [Saccharopolyspora phatthalungensis]
MRASAKSSDDTQTRLRRIELVTDSALAHLEPDDLLRELLHRVRDVLEVDTAAVMLYEPTSKVLIASAAVGIEDEVLQGVRIPVDSAFASTIAARRRPPILDSAQDPTLIRPVLREHGIRSLLGAPMLTGGETVGVLYIGAYQHRRFSEPDIHLLQLVADRIALATRASTSRTERTAARVLQHSLMPTRLPAVTGLTLDARYVPGAAPSIGGDWYDVFALPSGRIGIVIGDVVGNGLPAAVIMGRLRSALRAYALDNENPAQVLRKLDRKATHFEPNAMATVGYAVYQPATCQLQVSLAGHLAPALAGPSQHGRLAPVPVDPPIGLGVTRRTRRTSTLELPPDGVVCFYTDGLVEHRNTSIDDGLRRLCKAITPAPATTVCTTVMNEMVGAEPPTDDVALLTISRIE